MDFLNGTFIFHLLIYVRAHNIIITIIIVIIIIFISINECMESAEEQCCTQWVEWCLLLSSYCIYVKHYHYVVVV